jgi:hypothetical protein
VAILFLTPALGLTGPGLVQKGSRLAGSNPTQDTENQDGPSHSHMKSYE